MVNQRPAWQRFWPIVGAILITLGLVAGVKRFAFGLGAATNLTDEFPWGIWVGFDILCGVGLAAGGFTISALTYIFGRERYKHVARPAIMTAFIGYVLVVGGLIFDLGHPWRIWHPLVMWNHHSVMFEISWCVTLYTTVLAIEVSALVFEKFKLERTTHLLHKLNLPLTLAAVLLSMLHQSSLGSLFLLVPGHLHELWYSPLLPVLFFGSAIGAGLIMTIVESNLSARAFGRCVPVGLLQRVGRLAAFVLAGYVILRWTDLAYRGQLVHVLDFDRAAFFFLGETLIGFVIPIAIFANPRLRMNSRWLYYGALLGVFGFIVNRLNTAITGFEVVEGYTYVPSWGEVSVTLMLISIGVVAFNLAGRYLPVFAEEEECEARTRRAWEREEQWIGGTGSMTTPSLERAQGTH